MGDFVAARSYYQQTLDLALQLENTGSIATSLLNLGTVAYAQGELAEAELFFRQSLSIMESMGDPNGVAIAAANLGRLASYHGDHDAAKSLLERALSVAEGVGDTRMIATILDGLGSVAVRQGDARVAARCFQRSLNVALDLREKVPLLDVLRSFIEFENKYGSSQRAAPLWGFEEKERAELGIEVEPTDLHTHQDVLEMIRGNVGSEAIAALLALGRRMDLDQAVAFALTSRTLAEEPPKHTQSMSLSPASTAGLTRREIEVLRLVAQGMTDIQVAEELVISPRTVNAHLTSIYSKLGVNSRVAATRFAIDNGIVP